MNISRETNSVLVGAAIYAGKNRYEYITPEMVLLSFCGLKVFRDAFEECGGNIDVLRADLVGYCQNYIERLEVPENDPADKQSDTKREIPLSAGVTLALTIAQQQATNSGRDRVELLHLLYGILQLPESHAVYYLRKQEIDLSDLIRFIQNNIDAQTDRHITSGAQRPEAEKNRKSLQELYAPCLNDTLKDVNPLIGRTQELERTMEILCRRDKNNPLYIGEPGVGKTALVYGLVEKIRNDEVPEPLKGSRVFLLELSGMLAGTQYRGDFEKRFQGVLSDIEKEERPIIFIDEIHNLSGAGAVGESSFDAANLLKPYLSLGHIRFIGATTFDEHKKYFEKNKSLARRFQNIEITEPSEAETVEILKGLKPAYEEYHGIKYEKGLLEYAVSMSVKHINERFLPDKAIDLIDEAGAYRRLNPLDGKVQTVGKDVIVRVLTNICRVPVETVETDELSGLETLESRLKARIFGQDTAIAMVTNAVKLSRAGLSDEGKPLASLLFVGPTGVGKTEVARSLSEELGIRLVRFDMSEYEEKHAVAKLIGAPAGYVGYEEGGLLTGEIRKSPSCVLLLDEIEKAHPDIFNVLLQVMDYATLTDNQGRKADFRNVILIMTSNVGANRIGKKSIGFNAGFQDDSVLMEEVKRTFQPEFRNRLNKIVSFNGMDEDMAERIVDKKLSALESMLAAKKIAFKADEEAKRLIREKGITQDMGAREIDRVIRNEVKPLFVDEILFGKLKDGGRLKLTVDDGCFKISAKAQKKQHEKSKKNG